MTTEVLSVSPREASGTRVARRLRKTGHIPAILYGHGQQCVPLSVRADQFAALLRHGTRLVNLQGAVTESALIREVQWDPYGIDVLHIDLTRTSAEELVQVTLPVELRGDAPGTREGGVLQHLVHEVELECPAGSIPERIEVTINELHLGVEIRAGQVSVPPKSRLLLDPDEVIVQCTEPAAELEAEEGAVANEPELIRRPEREAEDEG